jgi:SET domain
MLEANTKSTSPEMAREVSRTAAELAKIANKHSLPLSAVDARSLLYSIQCNAHQIVSAQSGAAGIALGLFPHTSMMNHSCSPNCMHRFHLEPGKPPRLVMRAIANIDKGDELCYSYVNLYQSTVARREQLQCAYSFHCSCERCSAESSQEQEELSLTTSLQPSTSKTLGFLSDEVIDQVTDSSDADEVAAVERLIESQGVDSEELTLQRLKTFLGSSDAGMFHPAHRIMFRCYHSVCMSSIRLATDVSSGNSNNGGSGSGSAKCTVTSMRAAIGCGLLALGCMRVYVQRRHSEMGDLEEQIVKGAELLVGLLRNAPCSATDPLPAVADDLGTEPCTCEESTMPDSGDAVLPLLLDVGYVSSVYLGARGDGRLREIIKAACGLSSFDSSKMRSNDDTFIGHSHTHAPVPVPHDASSAPAARAQCGVNEKELRVLQHMIEKFKRSAEYTAHVCRSNIDTADQTDS